MLKKFTLLLLSILLLSACEKNTNTTSYQEAAKSASEQAEHKQYKNDLYISALTVEKTDDLLFIANRLKQLNNGALDHMVVVRLFTKQLSMTSSEQERMMEIVQGNMNEIHLASLQPLLSSENEAVAIGAFSLLAELEMSREIKKIHLNLSQSSSSEYVRNEAKNRAQLRYY